ncbi:hypothetical protein EDB92DRAFT_2119823 [Lactarius akahatsu]|uniref:Uncharacterized protein n=1 Tax=Lactarius akahatsu TaxID=416441 RepID=A0AAD4Q779_9AGAM|nr:hypothetical protein EDB92DRAFT_2119823 [Lactarius akahatsu]
MHVSNAFRFRSSASFTRSHNSDSPPRLPQRAAPSRGLSDSSLTCCRPRRPPLQIFVSRASKFKINASQTKVAPSAKFRVARKRARLFAIAHDHPTQQGSPTVPFPDCAALARSLSYSTQTRPQPLRAHLRRLAPRGGMRAHLRRFTPPKSCAPPPQTHS